MPTVVLLPRTAILCTTSVQLLCFCVFFMRCATSAREYTMKVFEGIIFSISSYSLLCQTFFQTIFEWFVQVFPYLFSHLKFSKLKKICPKSNIIKDHEKFYSSQAVLKTFLKSESRCKKLEVCKTASFLLMCQRELLLLLPWYQME